jgi:hypothetical protein
MVSRWFAICVLMVVLCGCSDNSPPKPQNKGPAPAPAAPGSGGQAKPAAPAPGTGSAAAQPAPGSGAVAPKPAPKTTEQGPDLVPPQTGAKPASGAQTGTPAVPPAPAVDPAAKPGPDMELVKAKAGVGKLGRSLDEHSGVIVTPAKVYFTVRERVVFDVQIPEALKLYKALNGKAPQSHEQFMKDIVEANQIQLPQLNPGVTYVYDPQTEELMVRRPKQ